MPEVWANNPASSTLTASITNSQSTITVASATGWPSTGNFRVQVGTEIMLCTSRSGTTLTVSRGQEGSTAASAASGASVYIPITSGSVVRWQLDRKATAITASGTTDASQSYCVGVFVQNANAGHTRINLGQNNGVTGQIVAVHNLGVLSASATAIDYTTVGAATENTTFPTINGRVDIFRPASLATFICDGSNGYLAVGQEELTFDISITTAHYQFAPRSKTWRTRTTVSGTRRGSARMVGRHVLFGGNAISNTDQYNQATDATSALTADSTVREWTRTGGIVGQYAYVHGGQTTGVDVTVNQRYSYVADAWTARTAMSQAKSSTTSFVLDDGKVYVSPGATGTVHEAYTPGSDSWTSKTFYTSSARKGTSWNYGQIGVSAGATGTSPTQGYSPLANAWTTYTAPGASLTFNSLSYCQIEGHGYVTDYGGATGTMQSFSLPLNTWYAQPSKAANQSNCTGIAL